MSLLSTKVSTLPIYDSLHEHPISLTWIITKYPTDYKYDNFNGFNYGDKR